MVSLLSMAFETIQPMASNGMSHVPRMAQILNSRLFLTPQLHRCGFREPSSPSEINLFSVLFYLFP
uniref:Uncharacterized protein n=1 Tax=Cucumis melo TaxID=3656 RepID=A0A9I9EHJ6_CUCME